ncbi:hypothetical protein MCOR02_010697 [Pyricularia oryzae]|uniref:Gfo/Idh/MocA-like oxidoreductase N-terminal domain-containing protein n=1 Tax=Pyricularia grisea TaxID=148305 RepID=A0ABQ8NWV5_PYRGI|nr:hypothetical protein MCOR01_002120 [Pyricularia oryzae]KAI6303294.1 hypothetical protein MCOR33_001557 [Pyricularia grisea]KAH9429291.1 hypothetical protein MCOR02_010697 [Pyricularia oryzae]KAI6263735.1 hypothetical protein MCOR19_000068 [Pyricularia oryzae]KAI6288184.1 hypothetical protein MCOR26_000192 [Pyricularia oryzae]
MAEPSENVLPPPPPPMSASPPRILIIGAGSRGQTYASAVKTSSNGVVVAVAEPDPYRRSVIGTQFIAGWTDAEPHGFSDWKAFVAYEKARRERCSSSGAGDSEPAGVDAVFVCVQDHLHREVVMGLAELGGLHVMCEKPLATRLGDCVDMYRALRGAGNVFSIGHVLRYSPHNIELRRLLLEERCVGDVLNVVHTEPVGWWHFSHSYVRGNWRREDTSAPSLLTKSCHDIDVLLWLLCAGEDPHLPSTVSSSGGLHLFKKSRKPKGAGAATNCLSCPIERDCKFSAKRIYADGTDSFGLRSLDSSNTNWPVDIVVPDIESYADKNQAREVLLSKLSEDYDAATPDEQVKARNWFGRCVWEGDNDVCDNQVVTLTWDEDQPRGLGAKQATFHMVSQTTKICQRHTLIYGEHGEVYADSQTISVSDFRTGQTTVHRPRLESVGHGGGDNGLTRQFVLAVDKVKNHGWSAERAQREIVGCSLEDVLRSHAMVFCAEDARKGRKVLDWAEWWRGKVQGRLAA